MMMVAMRKIIMAWGLLGLVLTAQANNGFIKTLPPDVFTAAGLDKLTPEELARLETAVQGFRAGVIAEVQQQAEVSASVSRQEAEQKIVAAESKARAAEAKTREAEAKAREAALKSQTAETGTTATPGKKQPGWFAALLTLNHAAAKTEKVEPLESRLVGDFGGWNGKSVFALENGTRWVQQNPGETHVFAPALHSPKVKIKPASLHGFWLQIEGVNLALRVVPVDLPE